MIHLHGIENKILHTLIIFSAGFLLQYSASAAEPDTKIIKTPANGISKIVKPRTNSAGAKTEKRRHLTLQHQGRTVNNYDYKKSSNKQPGITISKPSVSPSSQTQKKLLKPNNKTTSGNKTGQNNFNYRPLNQSGKIYTPSLSTKQWSDYSTHDSGTTILKPSSSNKLLKNNLKINHPSINHPLTEKPDTKNHKVITTPGEIRFGDGKNGRAPSPGNESKVPSYRTENKAPVKKTSK